MICPGVISFANDYGRVHSGSKVVRLSKERAEAVSDNMCMGAEDKLIVMGFAAKK